MSLLLNAVLMGACDSKHTPLCMMMNMFLWGLHSPAMWVHESSNPQRGHVSVSGSLYLYANLLLYSWPYIHFNMCMLLFGDLRIYERIAVPTVLVRAPRAFALRIRRI